MPTHMVVAGGLEQALIAGSHASRSGRTACLHATENGVAPMKATKILLAVVAVVGIGAAAIWLEREFAIDRYLDLGGRWDYAAAACMGERIKPNDKSG